MLHYLLNGPYLRYSRLYALSVTVALLVPTQAAWVQLLQGMPIMVIEVLTDTCRPVKPK